MAKNGIRAWPGGRGTPLLAGRGARDGRGSPDLRGEDVGGTLPKKADDMPADVARFGSYLRCG